MRQAQTAVWPAPIRGLQVAGTYVGAPNNAADVLDNFIPTSTGARLRGGAVPFATVTGAVERLMIYRSGAVEQMFAATPTTIVDVSSVADPEDAEGADVIGLSSGDWSFQQWGTAGGQFLLCVNGTDRYHYFDGADWNPITDQAVFDLAYDGLTTNFAVGETVTGGTSGASAQIRMIERLTATTGILRLGTITSGPFDDNEAITSATGAAVANGASAAGSTVTLTGITGQELSFVWSHKSRIWFVEKGTPNAWYLPTNQFGGAATKFPLTGIFKMGGALLFGGTWTVDSGTGIDDMQVFVSTEGEVAIYQGTDPASASTWAIVGTYRISRPINKHSWFRSGADFYIVTEEGIVSVADIMAKDRAQLQATAMTAAIEDLWRETVQKRVAGSKFALTVWPSENLFLIGVPSTTGQHTSLVSNTMTGAWARTLGWDVQAARVFNDRLYFGNAGGQIFRADAGGSDDGEAYVGVYVPKFQDFNSPETKVALHARAIWRADVPARVRLVAFTNYVANVLPALPETLPENLSGKWGASGKWGGGAKWGSSVATVSGADWQAVTGSGFSVAPGLVVQCNRVARPVFEILSMHLRFEQGSSI
jgi:hypothetical protein